MKLVIRNNEASLENISNKQSYVENILTRIKNLLKEENQTIIGPKLKKIEEVEKELITNNSHFDNLLTKSVEIERDTKKKLELLCSENTVIRKKLIEMLGSEK
jgi:hypothetical protein